MADYVLIVDDDDKFIQMVSLRLKSLGYEVAYAQDPIQANALIHQRRPNLLILDFMMPAGTGASLLNKIRYSGARMPVIVVSGTKLEEIQKSILFGLDVLFHPKPIDIRLLEEQVANLLRRPGDAG